MREIKFRAWDKIGKCWLESRLIPDFLTIGVPDDPNKGVFIIHDWRSNRIEVMQYTGLKDKHEKEIYEGDIVKIKHFGTKYTCEKCGHEEEEVGFGVIKFENEYVGDEYNYDVARYVYVVKCESYELDNPHDLEVIGNIYDNPDLEEKTW